MQICGEIQYIVKVKTKFRYKFNNYKSKHKVFRKSNQKVPQKCFHTHYCLDGHSGIDDWDFVIQTENLLSNRFKWKGVLLILTQAHFPTFNSGFQLIITPINFLINLCLFLFYVFNFSFFFLSFFFATA